MKNKFTHASLFSGIGGFDLAAEWIGWQNVFHCEWNPFCQKILNYHFPKSKSYEDITKTDFSIYRGRINILTGGFPCQPYSCAGKRLGTEDERHLWPHMLRAIREIQPNYVVGENVLGIVNWNGGLVFEEVQINLEAEGYEVQSFVLPAAGVNAPHQRYRTWFIAYTNNKRDCPKCNKIQKKNGKISKRNNNAQSCNSSTFNVTSNPKGFRSKYTLQERELEGIGFGKPNKRDFWNTFPSKSPLCDRNDGISGKLDGITFSKWRNESIKAAGNAIVPQVAYEIFKIIDYIENGK